MCSLLNDIISTGAGGAAAGLALYGVQYAHHKIVDHLDRNRVYEWLVKSGWPGYKFRSTQAIASYTNFTQDRIRFLCSTDKRIYLSRGESEDAWGQVVEGDDQHFNDAFGRPD